MLLLPHPLPVHGRTTVHVTCRTQEGPYIDVRVGNTASGNRLAISPGATGSENPLCAYHVGHMLGLDPHDDRWCVRRWMGVGGLLAGWLAG